MVKQTASGKSLVIVESPAKAKTINKYLGDDFVVKASMGHVRDLPARDYGIDIGRGFEPTYEIVSGRAKVVTELRKLASSAPAVYLATDLDREGEAIAWHLVEALRLPEEKVQRVIFNEITKSAIQEAFRHPHRINVDRVNAQQARRILDRIVGYELSPLLWKKIARGLSAGRVQSVAVRLVVEREREIRAFHPEENWKIYGCFSATAPAPADVQAGWAKLQSGNPTQKDALRWLSEHGAFRCELVEFDGRRFEPRDIAAARPVIEALGYRVEDVRQRAWEEYAHLGLQQVTVTGGLAGTGVPAFTVSDVTSKRSTTKPPAPFTTATLQQAASSQLGFRTSRTMKTAQALYEGIDLNGEGPVGLITYMRTDSTNLSGEAVGAARRFIHEHYGDAYVPAQPNAYGKRQARAQEAHEAIRPTDPFRTPESLRRALTAEQHRLYDLIWRRFVACQMTPAQWDATSVSVTCQTPAGAARFAGTGRKLAFDGFMKVAGVTTEDQLLPPLETGQPVGPLDLEPRQQFTSPPPRYTEASLVKTLEAEGIGRPSTYAAIIDTIQDRGYVEQEDRKFFPTALGELVTDKLVAHFPRIMDVKFTSHMEDELDKIEDAHHDWVKVLHEFHDPFRELLARAGEEMEAARSQPSEHACPECGQPMVYRWAKTGRFLACSGYPNCKATVDVDRDGRPRVAQSQTNCELCGKPMVLRQSRSGHFLGCSGYPECRNTVPCDAQGVPHKVVEPEELQRPCDECGEGTMVVKFRGRRAFLGCDRYPTCKHTTPVPDGYEVKRPPAPPPKEAGVACEKCGRPMVIRAGRRGDFIACTGFPRCRNTHPIEKLDALKAAQPAAPLPVATELPPGEAPPPPRAKATRRAAGATPGELGEPPPGFAWTRTGRPVVEKLPEGQLMCPECGSTMELKRSRFGPFYSCLNFPKCKFNANLRGDAKKQADELLPPPERPKAIPTDLPCPECGQPLLIRQGRRGKFLGCSAYPKCKTTQELPPGFDVAAAEAAAEASAKP